MKIGKKARVGAAAALAAAGVSAAVLSTISPAAATFSSRGLYLDIKVGSTAALVANGVAATVPVTITCRANYGGSVWIQLSQVTGKKLATGSANVSATCDGTTTTLPVTVNANGPYAFAKGDAYVTASLSGCGYAVCASDNTSATVKVTAK